jgi:hypothetical protein
MGMRDTSTPQTNMPRFEAVTDWAASDTIGFADFNRIETNVGILADYLTEIQYELPERVDVVGRTQASMEYLSSINRLETNIDGIRQSFVTPVEYPGFKEWSLGMGFTAGDINRLELDLALLYQYAQLVPPSFKYCGELVCGTEEFLP